RRNMRALKIFVGMLIGWCSFVAWGQQTRKATLFEGARLIPGDGGAPIESSAFVVENDRFTSVGRKGEIQAPPGAARIDLTGKTVLPALVDGHSHFGFLSQRGESVCPMSSRLASKTGRRRAIWRSTVRTSLSFGWTIETTPINSLLRNCTERPSTKLINTICGRSHTCSTSKTPRVCFARGLK